MFSRPDYQVVPLGDFDRFQQSSKWLNGSQRGFFSPRRTYDTLDQEWPGTGVPQGFGSQVCHKVVIALMFLFTILTFPISGWFVLKSPVLPRLFQEENGHGGIYPEIVPTYERVILFRLGRIRPPKGPGLILLLPFIDQWHRVDLRTRAFSVPPCKLTSQDGALVSVGADVQFHVCDPVLTVMMVKDLNTTTRMTAQNIMTKVLLKKFLREIQTETLKISDQLLLEINDVTKSWGLEVDRVELFLEAVLQAPPEAGISGKISSLCGGQGLDSSTIQQMALQFFSRSFAPPATSPKESVDSAPEVNTAAREEIPSQSSPVPSCSFRGERKQLVVCGRDDFRMQVDHMEVQSEPGPSTSPAASAATKRTMVQDLQKQFDPDEFLLTVNEYLSESLVNQIRACYQFNVQLPNGEQNIYFIDLSSGCGRSGHGPPDRTPDVILDVAESDLGPLVWGDLNPMNAYVSGRLRANGDLSKALKLELLFKAMR